MPVYVCDQVHVHVCMCDYFTSGHDRLLNACVCVCVCAGPTGGRPCYTGFTLPYASPELIRGLLGLATSTEHIDTIAQDLWSVACLMYEMITRHQLFQALDIYNDATDDATEILGLHTEMVG